MLMTLLIIIAAIWAIVSVTFFAALGLIAKRPTPTPSTQPATYHNGASGFAFADGHSEIHKWKGSLTQARAQRVKFNNSIDAPAKAGDSDIRWISYRGGRVSEKSY